MAPIVYQFCWFSIFTFHVFTSHIITGMQAQIWSETVRTDKQMDYMLFPRLLAVAERAWHKAPWEDDNTSAREAKMTEDWMGFRAAVGNKELLRLDEMDIKYRIPPPGAR